MSALRPSLRIVSATLELLMNIQYQATAPGNSERARGAEDRSDPRRLAEADLESGHEHKHRSVGLWYRGKQGKLWRRADICRFTG
jgi:hypothetical protein